MSAMRRYCLSEQTVVASLTGQRRMGCFVAVSGALKFKLEAPGRPFKVLMFEGYPKDKAE